MNNKSDAPMSDTPRTDAKEKETYTYNNYEGAMRHAYYGWKFARKLECELTAANKLFNRMEAAWRNELESWYKGEPNNPSHPSLLASLNGKLLKTEKELIAASEQLEQAKALLDGNSDKYLAWLNSLEKGVRRCKENDDSGDSKTLEEIHTFIAKLRARKG